MSACWAFPLFHLLTENLGPSISKRRSRLASPTLWINPSLSSFVKRIITLPLVTVGVPVQLPPNPIEIPVGLVPVAAVRQKVYPTALTVAAFAWPLLLSVPVYVKSPPAPNPALPKPIIAFLERSSELIRAQLRTFPEKQLTLLVVDGVQAVTGFMK
ncbi:MAG: hypothetical protein DDT19_02587 [Syntrophomonadaceae bacterium]|nr:hypothetical protein [Bacillota bacterium]